MSLNLLQLATPLISRVFANEQITLYQADGQKNVKGVIHAVYKPPQIVSGNVQPLDSETLNHLERIGDTKASRQVFLYSSETFPVAGIKRLPTPRGGDVIQRSDGSYWLITSVIEDWCDAGWCNVGITEQVIPPDFSFSDWGDDVA